MTLAISIILALSSFAMVAAAILDRRPERRMLIAIILLAGMVGYGLITRDKRLEVMIFGGYLYGLVTWNWLVVPCGYFIGLGVGQVRSAPRRMLYEIIYGFAVVMVCYSGAASCCEDYAAMSRRGSGDIRQSTGYSCGPAVAATALHRLGYAASEYDLCRIARPNVVRGTNEFLLAHAIDELCGGDTAAIFTGAITRGMTPCLAAKSFASVVGHGVVIEEVGDDGYRIFDPLSGTATVSSAAFAADYLGYGIRLRPPAAPAPLSPGRGP